MRGVARVSVTAWLAVLVIGCEPSLRDRLRDEGVFTPRREIHNMTPLARLGQLLFFDRELSGNRNIACATCHLPAQSAADDLPMSIGQNETPLARNTLEPFNRAFIDVLFWDGRVEAIDGVVHAPVPLPRGVDSPLVAQALLPLLDRAEMRGNAGDVAVDGRPNELALIDDADVELIWRAVLDRLMVFPEYLEAFAEAYPDVPFGALTIVHVARAIVAFEQFLWERADSHFDLFLAFEDELFLPEQVLGAELFFGDAGCSRCHSGPLFSDGEFHNIGVPQLGPGPDGDGVDLGRARVTGRESDRFAFRTPPLRNVELTAPYMHNGAYADLREAVTHHISPAASLARYGTGAFPLGAPVGPVHREHDEEILARLDADTVPLRPLGSWEIHALISFLHTLTSASELQVFAGAGVPDAVPSGLPVDGTPRL